MINHYKYFIIFFVCILQSENSVNFYHSGYTNVYAINRISDQSLIKTPFKLVEILFSQIIEPDKASYLNIEELLDTIRCLFFNISGEPRNIRDSFFKLFFFKLENQFIAWFK